MKTNLFFILVLVSIISFSCNDNKKKATDLMNDALIAKSDSGMSDKEILTIIKKNKY